MPRPRRAGLAANEGGAARADAPNVRSGPRARVAGRARSVRQAPVPCAKRTRGALLAVCRRPRVSPARRPARCRRALPRCLRSERAVAARRARRAYQTPEHGQGASPAPLAPFAACARVAAGPARRRAVAARWPRYRECHAAVSRSVSPPRGRTRRTRSRGPARERPGGHGATATLPCACERASPPLLVVFAAAHAGVSARACGDVPIVYAF